MAKVTIYVPDELHETAKSLGLNISGLTQNAIREAVVDENGWDFQKHMEAAAWHLEQARDLAAEA